MKLVLFFKMSVLTALICIFHVSAQAIENVESCPKEALKNINGAYVLVIVTSENWQTSNAKLKVFQRKSLGAAWVQNRAIVDEQAFIGENGMAWGNKYRDLTENPSSDKFKVEGDHKTPAGVFRFRDKYFGQEARSKDPNYLQILRPKLEAEAIAPDTPVFVVNGKEMVSNELNCSDDVNNAKLYDRLWYRPAGALASVEEGSGEQLGLNKLYTLGLHIEHETSAVSKSGSCIFVHQVDEVLLAEMNARIQDECRMKDANQKSECAKKIEMLDRFHKAGQVATYGCTALHKEALRRLVDLFAAEKSRGHQMAIASLPAEEFKKKSWHSCFQGIFDEAQGPNRKRDRVSK